MEDTEHVTGQAKDGAISPPGDLEKLEFTIQSNPGRGTGILLPLETISVRRVKYGYIVKNSERD